MAGLTKIRGFSRGRLVALFLGVLFLWSGLSERSGLAVLAGFGVLAVTVWRIVVARRVGDVSQPWPWPPEFRAVAEDMARPLDPTPERLLPPDEKTATIAHVARTQEELSRLIAE